MHKLSSQERRWLRRRLLAWFDDHRRDLPWRSTRELYHIWVSEIMLQQTQVATVVNYYCRFLDRFPTVAALAAADEGEVLRHWEGLGYYRRARQLHRAAQQIVAEHGGQFPERFDQVLALPGVGRYTAGAILSIGRDQAQPIVEANTIRLYSRLLAYREDPRAAAGQRLLWEFAESLLPRTGSGDFNQALMELGSEVCTPQEPACERCPLARLCPTRDAGLQALIPVAARRPRAEEVAEAAVVVRHADQVLLRRAGAGERWAGMWDFPRFEVDGAAAPARGVLQANVLNLTQARIAAPRALSVFKHQVTRFRITLHCYQAECRNATNLQCHETLQWVPVGNLSKLPLSVTGRKIAKLIAAAASQL